VCFALVATFTIGLLRRSRPIVRPASLWYMCVSHRSRSSKPHVQTSQNFMCTLRMAVDRSSSDERRQCNIWPICTGWRRKKWNIHNSCLHIFGNTNPDLITFLCMLWPWVGHFLPALCTLCTSGLVDDVIFSNNGLYGASDASTVGLVCILKVTYQGATLDRGEV